MGIAAIACGARTDDTGTRNRRRAAFVEAALDCLAEHGLAGTTVRRISERAGVAPGLLTHYFAGKDALIAAAYEALGKRFDRHFDDEIGAAGSDPVAKLTAFLAASFRAPNLDQRILRIWVNFWSLTVTDPRIREIHARNYAGYRARVAALVRDAVTSRGHRMTVAQAEAAAIGVSAILDGLWLELCLDSSAFDPEKGERIAAEIIGRSLGIEL